MKQELWRLATLGGAMILFMAANIILGMIRAGLQASFDKEICCHGLLKALAIALAFACITAAGLLIPNMEVVRVGSMSVTTLGALHAVLAAGIVLYAYKTFTNLRTLLGMDTAIDIIGEHEEMTEPSWTRDDDTAMNEEEHEVG